MATVIDSLVVSLGLDAKKFNQGQKEAVKSLKDTETAAKKTGDQLDKSGKAAAEAFSSLKRELLSVVGLVVAAAGIKSFVSGMLETTSAVQRMSNNLSLNKKEIFEWRLAAELAGGSAEDAVNSISKANDELARYKKYREVSQGVMFNGVNIAEATDGLDLLMRKSEAVARARSNVLSTGGTQNSADAQGMLTATELGISAGLYSLIKDGPIAARKSLDAQSKYAEEMAKLAPEAEKTRQEWVKVSQSLEKIGVEVLEKFMPAIQKFAIYLTSDDFQKDLVKLEDGIKDVADVTLYVAKKLKNFLGINEPAKVVDLGGHDGKYTKDASGLIDKNDPNNYVGGKSWWGRLLNSQNPSYQAALKAQAAKAGESKPITPSASSASSAPAKPSGDLKAAETSGDSKARIIAKLKSRYNYTDDEAWVIAGNLQAENGKFDPSKASDNPRDNASGIHAYGLAQWRGERLKAFEAKYGHALNKGTEDEQLEFLNSELKSGKYNGALSGSTRAEKVASFLRVFEAPSQEEQIKSFGGRLAYAGVGSTARAQATVGNSTSTQVTINTLNVQTAATDSTGIARDLPGAIRVAYGATGMTPS